MKKRWIVLALAALLCVAGAASAQTAYVSGGSLRVREAPDRSAQALGSLYEGAPVEVTGASGEWSQVQLSGVTGYVMTAYLSASPAQDATRQGTVVSPYGTPTVMLRSRPSNSYGTVGMLSAGEGVRVLGEMNGSFYCVNASSGTGFLSGDEVR